MSSFVATIRLKLSDLTRRQRQVAAAAAVVLGVYGSLLVIGLAVGPPAGLDEVRPGRPLPGQVQLGLRERGEIRTIRVGRLFERFDRQGYDLDLVVAGQSDAPRAFLARLPKDWTSLNEAAERKRAFVMVMLPLVLRANERILAHRRRVLAAAGRQSDGETINRGERIWLKRLGYTYELDDIDLRALRLRVDIVPPSLAIAQAAIESGWGTSRFVGEGNALFGEWTEQGRGGMIPAGRDPGRTYAIRRFATLGESIASYVRNLNTHGAYRQFRARRAELRRQGAPLDGALLAETLSAYSEQGREYVTTVRRIIAENGLGGLDRAELQTSER